MTTRTETFLRRIENVRPPVKIRKPGLLWLRLNYAVTDESTCWIHLGDGMDISLSLSPHVFETLNFEFCKVYQEPEEWTE